MLSSSDSNSPNFVACILEIGLKHAKNLRLDVNAISVACLNSLQQPLGIILLEEYLILNENDENNDSDSSSGPPSVKRLKFSSDYEDVPHETLLWIELARLYRSMNDYDSIKGIFEKNKTLTTEYTQRGFEFESNCDYYRARMSYYDALNHDWNADGKKIPSIEKELWEQSLLRCSNELTDWKQMQEWSLDEKKLSDLFKSDTYSLENLFPYAFRSKIKLILQETNVNEQKKHEDLVQFIAELDSDDKTYLETLFSQELALFNLHQKDLNASKYYANKAIQNYLDEWSSINKTIMQSRITKLQSLQTIVELNEFLKFIDTHVSYSSDLNKKVSNLISLWSNSMPNILSDPPRTWDDVITNRCIYYEFIEDKYYTENLSSNMETSSFAHAANVDDENDDNYLKKGRNYC